MFGPAKTEDIKRACRMAYVSRDKAAFSDAATHLLIRGYAPIMGTRGGISFKWVGATRDGDHNFVSVREQFAGVEWKEDSNG